MTPASKLALALLVVHLVGVATAAPSAAGNDEVLQLPNLNRKPCWRSFSGYLPVAGQACLLNSLMPGAQLASAAAGTSSAGVFSAQCGTGFTRAALVLAGGKQLFYWYHEATVAPPSPRHGDVIFR